MRAWAVTRSELNLPTHVNHLSTTCLLFSIEGHMTKPSGTRLPVFLNCTHLIFFVASVCYAIMKFICDNEKENWKPGDGATFIAGHVTNSGALQGKQSCDSTLMHT